MTKDYNFCLYGINLTSNDRCQNTFVCQPALNSLELKDQCTDYL